MLLITKGSKVVFVAFTQHCIQSNFTHLTHVKRVKRYTVIIVTHVTHVKGVKRSLNSFTHNFLNIQPIFNPKMFWELRQTFPTIPSNAIYVEGVESYFDFRPLQHASTYIAFDSMVGKV